MNWRQIHLIEKKKKSYKHKKTYWGESKILYYCNVLSSQDNASILCYFHDMHRKSMHCITSPDLIICKGWTKTHLMFCFRLLCAYFFSVSLLLQCWQQSPGTVSVCVQSSEGQGRGEHSLWPSCGRRKEVREKDKQRNCSGSLNTFVSVCMSTTHLTRTCLTAI